MEFISSPNFSSRNGKKIEFIIIHWFGIGSIDGAIASFQNSARQASAHYLISNNRIVQMVDEVNCAWHCGNLDMNQRSIGIEHDAGIDPARDLSEESYQTSGKLIREICDRYGIPLDRDHIKKHNEIKATQCPGTIDLDKLIDIAKGGTMTDSQKSDIATALVIARCGKIIEGEVNFILANYGEGKSAYSDYAINNIVGDNHIPMLWKATLGADAVCPQSEIDHYKVAFRNGDLQLIDLAGNWYKDHVLPFINKPAEIKEVIKEVPVDKIVEKIVYQDKIVYRDKPNAIVTALKSIMKLKSVQKLIDLLK